MKFQTTSVYERNALAWRSGKRRAINQGGVYSSKTYSALQLLILIAQNARSRLLVSVVSESLPHLRKGAIRDFRDIMGDSFNESRYNKTEHIYNFGNGIIEFFGADESAKVRGPRRDILFINEANNVPWETARGLDARTRKFTIIDYNPVSEFWAHEHWIGQPENEFITSTYRDAVNVVSPDTIEKILAIGRDDPNWANVYLEGRIGRVEGLVYPCFEQIAELPEGGDVFYGLDFGYSTDPTALVRCAIVGDGLYCQELIYEVGLTNDAIAHRMDELGIKRNHDEIFADAAEPKSIDEIHRFGFNIKPAPKGPGSVEYGHQKIRQYRQFWTKDSTYGIKEMRNYRYIEDKSGKLTDKTTHGFSHIMDARRYGLIGFLDRDKTSIEFW